MRFNVGLALDNNMKILQITIFAIIIFSFWGNAASAENGRGNLPLSKSEFEGWKGFKIEKHNRCDECCELIFPVEFGRNQKELNILEQIAKFHLDIKHDLDCFFPVNINALDRILFLATEKQDKNAALRLVSPNPYERFSLDGYLAEDYAELYLIPVLTKYKKLEEIISPETIVSISKDICSWAEPMQEIETIENLITALKRKSSNSLATQIERSCKF